MPAVTLELLPVLSTNLQNFCLRLLSYNACQLVLRTHGAQILLSTYFSPSSAFAASMRSPELFLTLVLFSTCEDLASLQKKKKRCYVTITETIGIVPTSLKFAKEECIRGDWWSNSMTFWHWGHTCSLNPSSQAGAPGASMV